MSLHIQLAIVIVALPKLTKDGGHTSVTSPVSNTCIYEVSLGHD
jgi:hypothetical protein